MSDTTVRRARVRDCLDWRRPLLDAYKIEYEKRCDEIEALEAERDRLLQKLKEYEEKAAKDDKM